MKYGHPHFSSPEADLSMYPRMLIDSDQEVELFRVKKFDPYWNLLKSHHYVEGLDIIGRQLHYLIIYQSRVLGAITGAQSIWGSYARDQFWGITNENRHEYLNTIVGNSFFRLDGHVQNLGTRSLKLFREKVVRDWTEEYGDPVWGFETMVDPHKIEGGSRNGAVYLADNWTYVGMTAGFKKSRAGVKSLYNVPIGDLYKTRTGQKLLYCRWSDSKKQNQVDRSLFPVLR